jgi:hypothetical protein
MSKNKALEWLRKHWDTNWYDYDDLLPLNASKQAKKQNKKEDQTQNAT